MAGYAARAAAARAQLQALVATALKELPSARRLAGVAAAVQADMRRQVALLCAPVTSYYHCTLDPLQSPSANTFSCSFIEHWSHFCTSHPRLLLL